MALNAASHNPTGEKTGPVSGQPPPPSDDTKNAVLEAANGDLKGHNAPGQDGGDKKGETKQKSEKELAKEKAKAEKIAKLAAKQEKQKAMAAASQPKQKEKKQQQKLAPYVEETTKGEKKILKPLDDEYHKAYIPSVVESAWYDWWEREGFHLPEFQENGEVKPKGSYVISIPPPNVTGALHIGHALATSLQDALIRWNRMKGLTVLYVPGCDHAGISTQSVVENMLYNRRNGLTRHDLGREKFVETVWEWKEEYHMKINKVMKRLGGSMDWTREAFTMSPILSAAVRKTFVQLHDEGLIYRANRLVNWCTKLNTALSNLEVDQKDLEGATKLDVPGYDKKIEFGCIWNFKYPIDGTNETIEVATTRPETMLGDSGVAVHPSDERYKHLIGKHVKHPFVDRLLPIFGDETVEKDFGTGAVKITPAHDFNDFKRGKEHNLDFINILTDDGLMNANAGPIFEGQKRFDVRYSVITELEKRGLYVGKADNKMAIPLCNKSKDVIEPVMKPQWWMQMKPLAGPAIDVVKNGQIKMMPEGTEKTYIRWMENVDDWCLSRQLWWGHQVPAYFVKLQDGPEYDTEAGHWVCGATEEEAKEKAEKKFPGKKFELERDPDCLDTWFSSGLWPFSTLGWPEQTHDLQKLYPTSMLETGWDILFFWVARMIFFGLKMTGQVPFTEVYCHSLIRDSEGRKMSKSLGNVIDPVDIMDGITLDGLTDKLKVGNLAPKEIERASKWQKSAFPDGIDECGADALRFSLINYTTGGGDINFDVKVMRSYRNFCNKIYQATKYVLGNLPADFVPQEKGGKTGKESLPERWILHKMTIAAKDVNEAMETRQFSNVTQALHRYWLYELCDVYIENSKSIIRDGTEEQRRSAIDTLYTALDSALRMMHPIMPFLTEELWQRLPRRPKDTTKSIVIADYPQYESSLDDPESDRAYELILGCSKGVRSLIQEYGIKDDGKAFVQPHNDEAYNTAHAEHAAIKALSGKHLAELTILNPGQYPPAGSAVYPVSSAAAVFVQIGDKVEPEKEIQRLKPKLEATAKGVSEQERVLGSLGEKVRGEVRKEEERKLQELLDEQKVYQQSLEKFEEMKL
ncbi:uncharacterized protein LTR77_003994 [Saxophila tyrrhenica]|uniref:Valine--tRNA ligase, mitochondrial n=1 Tax=Saxophila tyrrhenica TaxID=1690608 RepID=A0AAV9PFR8_9PEZI|nr:hypothetical protein LTR77_003994 [Saxophila tyrrhenica]